MTDIEFSEIRAGQTVRLHYGYTEGDDVTVSGWAEGPVAEIKLDASTGPYLWLGTKRRCLYYRRQLTRVELLSEPAPTWKVGQLAEITWTGPDGMKRANIASWNDGERDGDDPGWEFLTGGFILPADVNGEPRLMVVVPADSRVVTQDAVVLPMAFPELDPSAIRSNADYIDRCCNHPASVRMLRSLADAIEEAQR